MLFKSFGNMTSQGKLQWLFLHSLWLIFCVSVIQINAEESSEDLFKKHEKELKELKKLAEDGGHPKPDSITQYDKDVCYSRDCIEAGKKQFKSVTIFFNLSKVSNLSVYLITFVAKEYLSSTNFEEDPCKKGSWLKYVCVRRTMRKEESDEYDDMNEQSQVGYLGTVALGQTLGRQL